VALPSFDVYAAVEERHPDGRTLVASIGPVCSAALRKLGVRVDIEAQPPKLGPLIDAINAALSDPRRLGKS
jgi:uroporphyrinogen-III synthase